MSMKKTLGGDRLGSGSRMQVELHNYERSTHNLGYLWRSTMSAGTLVPFMSEVALPGDTFDIKLDCDIKTHPTVGPLFGSYKVQLDVFLAPIRLYQGELHNNKLGIGNNMKTVMLPKITLNGADCAGAVDLDNAQVNPSCVLSYLGIRGIGYTSGAARSRSFNAVPILAYWDIYKNYYANKQEGIGVVVHTQNQTPVNVTTSIQLFSNGTPVTIPLYPTAPVSAPATMGSYFILNQTAGQPDPNPNWYIFNTTIGLKSLAELSTTYIRLSTTQVRVDYNANQYGNINVLDWRLLSQPQTIKTAPTLSTFPLGNLDTMREYLLKNQVNNVAININDAAIYPYKYLTETAGMTINAIKFGQEGLAIKTYQSDLFNNWLAKETFDYASSLSAVSTASGSFTIDTLNLSKKVYNMLNRIMVSGGTYDDWLDAVYTHERYTRQETPAYQGGLIKELVFQEVISNAEATSREGSQPLGTLAGRGVMSGKHKGGYIHVKVDEPGYVIGIISLTPRLDYSQGNKWDGQLKTMDDLHKPALDEIGFQDLITEQMAWWATQWDTGTVDFKQYSAGKTPAWMNYMTNVNQTRGNFAIKTEEMWMTLNRRYEWQDKGTGTTIKDQTSYIDPVKFNQIFAVSSLDAQNFWAQIAVDIEARRKMSAKVMPNL